MLDASVRASKRIDRTYSFEFFFDWCTIPESFAKNLRIVFVPLQLAVMAASIDDGIVIIGP